MRYVFLFIPVVLIYGCSTPAQMQQSGSTQQPDIRSAKLYRTGDQTAIPVIALNSNEALHLVFDDFNANLRNYYYTFELRNADWSPGIMKPFEYIRGFQNNRITLYRNSSLTTSRYINYQATIPDRNMAPSRSGNYLLKVFLDNDTSRVVLTKRFVVVDNKAVVNAQVQQPFNAQFYNAFHKLFIAVQTDPRINILTPTDLKVVVLQNNSWQTSLYIDRPTIFRGNYYEYNDEQLTTLPAGREYRWLDMRSLRLMSDRMQEIRTGRDTTVILVKPEAARISQPYLFYRDLNGSYTLENTDNANPFWQSDYAFVHFRYIPPGNREIPGNDVYIFGEMTNYASDTTGKMEFNDATGMYEKQLFLKQGYYSYNYATVPRNRHGPVDFSQTEGNFWSTENIYTVIVYYRPFGARSDEVIGYVSLNSLNLRP